MGAAIIWKQWKDEIRPVSNRHCPSATCATPVPSCTSGVLAHCLTGIERRIAIPTRTEVVLAMCYPQTAWAAWPQFFHIAVTERELGAHRSSISSQHPSSTIRWPALAKADHTNL